MKYDFRLFRIKTGLVFIVLFFSFRALAQNVPDITSSITEGKVVYQLDFLDTVFNKNPIKESLYPKEIISLFKEQKFRLEIQSESTNSSIYGDFTSRSTDNFLEVMHRKYHIKFNLDTLHLDAFQRNPFTVISTKETKTILGFLCQKLIIHYKNPYMKDAEIYLTKSLKNIPIPIAYAFSDLPGMILEATLEYQGILVHITAKQVQRTQISASYFDLPTSPTLITVDEFIHKVIKQ